MNLRKKRRANYNEKYNRHFHLTSSLLVLTYELTEGVPG
jgi:hypothetical protein